MKNPFNYPKGCRKLPVQRSFLENVGGYFFYLGKTLNWVVLMAFHGDLNFFYLHVKPLQLPNLEFCPLKKNNHPHFKNERCINSYLRLRFLLTCLMHGSAGVLSGQK